MEEEEILSFDLYNIAHDSPHEYMIEVDMVYPEDIHNDHNDYPLAPENLTITSHMVSLQ